MGEGAAGPVQPRGAAPVDAAGAVVQHHSLGRAFVVAQPAPGARDMKKVPRFAARCVWRRRRI